jgi:hypothetical protein
MTLLRPMRLPALAGASPFLGLQRDPACDELGNSGKINRPGSPALFPYHG